MLITLQCILARQELSLLLRDPLRTQGTLATKLSYKVWETYQSQKPLK